MNIYDNVYNYCKYCGNEILNPLNETDSQPRNTLNNLTRRYQ